jgi:hypothetical protein
VAGRLPKHGHCGDGLHLKVTDALGKPVALGAPDQERVTVVIFMSRSSKDEAAEFLGELDTKLLNDPVESLSVVDVRNFGGVMRGIASWQLKRAAADARDKRKQRRETGGLDASEEFIDRWHLVGDFDGKIMDKFGVAAEPQHPVAFVVDRCGVVGEAHRDVGELMAEVDHVVASKTSRAAGSSKQVRAWQ